MKQLRALDLFGCAGGATRGLQLAGFHVTGIDIKPQPRYIGDAFIQADALRPPVELRGFDFIWASPPCQAHVGFNSSWNKNAHVSLIASARELLQACPVSVIENVVGSPLRKDLVLCGTHFSLGVRRHRIFEASFPLSITKCTCKGKPLVGVYGDHPQGHFGDGYRIPRALSPR
jgi:DNA (cytosine-5)-methyltransferase 1